MLLKLVVVCLCVIYRLSPVFSDCNLNFGKDNEKYAPIVLTSTTSSLITPKKGQINLGGNGKILLACPGSGNFLTETNTAASQASCKQNKNILISGKIVNFEDLKCKKIIKGEEFPSNVTCAPKHYSYTIGYKVTGEVTDLISVCYNPSIGRSFYSQHKLYGKEINDASKTSYRPSFINTNNKIPYEEIYLKKNQITHFKELLGDEIAKKYINDGSYLARGHLAPDADFLLATWQYSTYHYINTIPQWQSINQGNWKKIESMTRKLAASLQDTFVITTGNSGISTLEGKKLYLGRDQVPVPKFVWKIIYNESSKKAIVLVIMNDPFTANYKSAFCKNICDETGWGSKLWSRVGSGLVFCCDYKSFRANIEDAPYFTVKGLLYFPIRKGRSVEMF